MDTTSMGPAFAVLAAGAVIGIVAAIRSQGTDTSIQAETQRLDLQSTYDEVMTALKQLDLDKDKLDPADYEAERKSLLHRGAAALRSLQGGQAIVAAPSHGLTLSSLPDLPMPAGADDTLEALRDLLDEHGSERFRAAIVALAKERPKAVVPGLAEGAEGSAPAPAPVPEAAPVPAAPAPVAKAPAEQPTLAPQYQGALAVVAILALLGALYYVAIGDSVDRREGAGMTGNQDLGTAAPGPNGPPPGMPPMLQQEIDTYEKALAQNPTDLDALNGLTEIYLGIGDAGKAMEYNNKAFEAAPEDPSARTYKAVLRAMVGMFAPAIADLENIVAAHPDHAMAWTYLGLVAYDKGDKNRGLEALRKAVELQPENFGLKQALDRAEQGLPLNGGEPPPPPPPAPAGGGEVLVSGTIALADGVKAQGSEVVFVSLRGAGGGPPLAAKKLRASDLPGPFEITSADRISMGGAPGPMPANVNLSVRLDADNDGNAFTKTPMDPSAMVEGVVPGATGVAVTLAVP